MPRWTNPCATIYRHDGTENNHKTNNVSVVQDTMRPVFVLRAVRMSLHKNYNPPSEINDSSVFQSTTV